MSTSEDTPEPSPAPEPAPAPSGSRWNAGRVTGLILTGLAGLLGVALLLGGLGLLAAHAFVRDDDGFYTSDEERIETTGYAVATGLIDLGTDPADWAPDDLLGTLRVRVEDPDGAPVFVGIASDADVDRYLSGVGYSELTGFDGGDPEFDDHAGVRPARPPGAERFWVASSSGSGEREVDWDVESGQWKIVVMNADGGRGVTVDADAGVKLDWLIWAAIGLAVVGLVLTVVAVALARLIYHRAERAGDVA